MSENTANAGHDEISIGVGVSIYDENGRDETRKDGKFPQMPRTIKSLNSKEPCIEIPLSKNRINKKESREEMQH